MSCPDNRFILLLQFSILIKPHLKSQLCRVLKVPQVLRVWLDLVVLLVCQVSVEREASLDFRDLL